MRSKKKIKVIFARKLRKDQTDAEEQLWWLLRNRFMLGHKFRRQYVYKGFILDFYCPAARLGIEIDGKIHDKQKEYDSARQKLLNNHGINIIRFTNDELFNEPIKVLDKISQTLPLGPLLEKEREDPDERRGG